MAKINTSLNRVVRIFNADSDPSFHLKSDPDPTFYCNAVPDPTFRCYAVPDPDSDHKSGLRPLVFRLITAPVEPRRLYRERRRPSMSLSLLSS
jgi:hypothetical protein